MEPHWPRRAHIDNPAGSVVRTMSSRPDDVALDVVTLRLEDDLDAATAGHVAALLGHFVQRGSRVVLDMSAVPFLDCAGLTELLRAQRRAEQGGGWLRLTSVRKGPLRMLELTGTADLLLRRCIPEQRDGTA